MSRYVDADIAIKEIEKRFYFLSHWMSYEAKYAIEETPTADVRENVHGKWVRIDGMAPPEYHNHYECSLCGWHLGHHDKTSEIELKFCPNCGAVMDQEQE